MKTAHALSSTYANVKDVVGGRKTKSIVGGNETGAEAVLVIVGHDDAVMFSDDVESVPSLEREDDDMEEEEEEEESEEEWDSEDEEEYDEGKWTNLVVLIQLLLMARVHAHVFM